MQYSLCMFFFSGFKSKSNSSLLYFTLHEWIIQFLSFINVENPVSPRNSIAYGHQNNSTYEWKKTLREMQTLRAGCSKAEPKIFATPQTPFPGARDGQNLISWRWSLSLPINPVWWGSMHAISSYHGNRPTNTHPHPHKQTHRQDRLQYTAPPLASAQCNKVTNLHYALSKSQSLV